MNKVVKIILIGAVVVNGCAGAYLAMNPDRIPKKETVATVKKEVPPKREYYSLSSKVLHQYYETWASKYGTGVPEIDESFMYFENYSKDGLQVTKNIYSLGGNTKIKHKYTMTFRQKTGEVVFLMIDGKVIMSDDKKKAEAQNDYK